MCKFMMMNVAKYGQCEEFMNVSFYSEGECDIVY